MLPGNLSGTQGSPVLWVSDPDGIDCRVANAAVAMGHLPGKTNGLDLLIEILSDQEMFRQVYKALHEVPHRVANPGLRLTGQDDEAATFAVALTIAIRALCTAGPGAEGPFRELLPSAAQGVRLGDDGVLARYRDEVLAVAEGAGRRSGLGGRFRSGQSSLHTRLLEASAALSDLREDITKLLKGASTVGELTENQRQQVRGAGIVFAGAAVPAGSARGSGPTVEQSQIYLTVTKAIQGGDALPLVSKRLSLTERELKRNGSASYLPEVGKRCPQQLIDRLANSPERPARRGADSRPEEDLSQAADAARALEDLIVTVAGREWSPNVPSRPEVGRIRAALDGAATALTDYADKAGSSGQAGGARPARLAEMLAPVVRDLVFQVVNAETGLPSPSALEALDAAKSRTDNFVREWVKRVQDDGISAQTPFPSSTVSSAALSASPDDVSEIREVLLYEPVNEMWQLCRPEDLKSVLNLGIKPEVVGFASRLNKDALALSLSRDYRQAWTSSGSSAGLLRLVSLRPEYVSPGHAVAGSDDPDDPELT